MSLDLSIDNRFTFHPVPDPKTYEAYGEIREWARVAAHRLSELAPSSPELSRALTHLDQTVMCANAAIARHGLNGA